MTLAYLSGPIIHTEDRRDDFYRIIMAFLEEKGIEVFAPQVMPHANPEEIYERDVRNVRACDFLDAEVSSPSHGVGMEIMLAIELSKPILLFFDSSSRGLSKMVSGAPGNALFNYLDIDDVTQVLERIDFENLIVDECPICDSQVVEATENQLRCVSCNSLTTRV
ncbi:MAG: nucleoside 2-deoxyribosyltransferase [Candidatus Thorarchaeota archaeon]|jgi:nucleoside 2-deoxyribosyltransferase